MFRILKLLVIGLFCSLLSSCAFWQNRMLVDQIPKQLCWQQQATRLSVKDFFAYRMQNKLRKAEVGNWLILHQDPEYVYLGYPSFVGLFDERREIETLYQVSKIELEAEFPGWQEIDGAKIRALLLEHFKPQLPVKWHAQLEQQQILVEGQLEPNTPFKLKLNAASLAIIE